MARPKSTLHQLMTYRRLRWEAARRVVGPVGPLARALNFHTAGLRPAEAASEIVEDRRETVTAAFSDAERAMIRDLCSASDADAAASDATGTAEFTLRTSIVRGAEVLGHTGAVALPDRAAILWPADGAPNWNVAKPRRLRRLPRLEGRAVSLTATNHYFHFLMNDIVPLIDYMDRLHPREERLAVVVPGGMPGFVTATLGAMRRAWPEIDVVPLDRGDKLPVGDLVALERRTANREWFVWDRAPVDRLKQVLLASLGEDEGRTGPERLFVTRGGARVRRLSNEADLIRIAEARGFTPFEPAAGNFDEQIRRFDAARQVIAVHGAGLTNLMWSRPGAHVLELFPASFVKSTYLWLADRMGLSHHALVGSPGDGMQAFSVDPAAFERALDDLDAAGDGAP